jgi:hypothetical protein
MSNITQKVNCDNKKRMNGVICMVIFLKNLVVLLKNVYIKYSIGSAHE